MELNRKNIRKLMGLIAFGVLLLVAALHYTAVLSVLNHLGEILQPVIIGLCVAFVLNVILRPIENGLLGGLTRARSPAVRRLARPLGLLLTLVLVLGIIVMVPLVMFPQLKEAILLLISGLPPFINRGIAWVQDLFVRLDIDSEFIENLQINWNSVLSYLRDLVVNGSSLVWGTATGVTASILAALGNAALGVIIAFYILARKERVGQFAGKLAQAALPRAFFDSFMHVIKVAYEAFSNFIVGQLIEAVILGSLCFLGMSVFRFPYAAAISVLVGFTALIPIIGALIGEVVGAFLILMVDPLKALLFLIFVLALQAVEGNFIYPKVVGKSVGLPGLLVLVSVIVGGNVGGVFGILMAVPVCSMLYVLAKEFIERRERRNAPPPPPAKETDAPPEPPAAGK